MADIVYTKNPDGTDKVKTLEDVSPVSVTEALAESQKIVMGIAALPGLDLFQLDKFITEFVHWLYSKEGEHFKISDIIFNQIEQLSQMTKTEQDDPLLRSFRPKADKKNYDA